MSSKSINPQTKAPYKVLWFGDLVAPSGFGRIGNEITRRLRARGYDVQGAAINYGGWPHDFPFWIWPLAGQDIWNGLVGIVNQWQPDIIVSCQDFPYHHTIWHGCRIDFSRIKWVWITPIDGTPVHPDWAKLTDYADGAMVISRFGVEALRQAGRRVALCHPGVDTGEFYPLSVAERAALREKAGLEALTGGRPPYVVGVVCMNQGRKAIAPMIAAFHEFALDKPEAVLILDMDKVSPAGWDIPNLLKQMGWSEAEQRRVLYREDLFKADMESFSPLRNRYALMDCHMVISHREGFGLPLLESMACRVPTLALDWCSGTELVGEGRGVLVKRLPYMEHGSWGGAQDAFPDLVDLTAGLNRLYADKAYGAAVAAAGFQWAIQQSWDVAADQTEAVITSALQRNRKDRPDANASAGPKPNPAPGYTDILGPGARPASPVAVSDRAGLQQPGRPDPLSEKPGANGGAGSPGLAAGDAV